MKNTKEILIDKYILNTISEEELLELKSYFKSDLLFQNETKLRMNIYKSVETLGDAELKAMLDKIHNKVVVKEKPKSKMGLIIGGLLSLLLVSIAGYFMMSGLEKTSESSMTPMAMYENYYTSYDNSLGSRDNDQESYLMEFNDAYNAKDFNIAFNVIKEKVDENDDEVKLMAAIAAIESDELEFANNVFSKIIASNSAYYLHHALWYRALVQIRLNNLDSASKDLNQIVLDKMADHYVEAAELLETLKLSQ